MKYMKLFILLIIPILLVSCGQKQEGTDAEVSEAKDVSEVNASQDYVINASESSVKWIGSKPTGKHSGSIPVKDGNIAVENGNIVGGKITMNVSEIENEDLMEDKDMQSKLVTHLKSAEFFDVENHPMAEFVITSVVPFSKKDSVKIKKEFESQYKPANSREFMIESPTHKITGNLTMRGKTLSVSFPASVKMQDDKLIAKAKFNIDRTQWGLQYGDEASAVDKAKDKFIYNTVNVAFDITAKEGMNNM